ncbi:MAG: biotin-dependent carboxyltransferase family protein [Betaproteobacteria bacterium]
MNIVVERPGLLTTLQDLGRVGRQHLGVPVNGAMDEVSHRMANWLVGNDDGEATLEMTLTGPALVFGVDAVIAVCGAGMGAKVDGEALPQWRPVRVPAGAKVVFGRAQWGSRAYLAVAAGFDVPAVMESRSTALLGGYGGFRGRALRKGDVIDLRSPDEAHTVRWIGLLSRSHRGLAFPSWSVSRARLPRPQTLQTIRVVPGRHWQAFPVAVRDQLTQGEYRVLPDSDRMGFRLDGQALEARRGNDVLSEGVVMGAVQVPPGGQPIVLMADRQTAGGYPVIAVVASIDLPLMAQLAPGDRLRFELITLEQSYAELAARERKLGMIREALWARLR